MPHYMLARLAFSMPSTLINTTVMFVFLFASVPASCFQSGSFPPRGSFFSPLRYNTKVKTAVNPDGKGDWNGEPGLFVMLMLEQVSENHG